MQKGKNAKHCFVHEMSEFASFFVLCAHALDIFHLKHHIYSMMTERTTSVHAYVHAHRPQLSIWCSCDLLINLLTDLLTHQVTDDEYHQSQSQRGSALSSSLYSNQSKSHHSELDALVSRLRVTTSSCLRLSEFYVETVTHMLQPPVSCWMMCVSPFLNYILHRVALVFQPAIFKKKKTVIKGETCSFWEN